MRRTSQLVVPPKLVPESNVEKNVKTVYYYFLFRIAVLVSLDSFTETPDTLVFLLWKSERYLFVAVDVYTTFNCFGLSFSIR